MPDRPGVGVGVIVTRGDQVLLLKRSNVHGSGTWSTPGGHLDYGESPEACAVREVKEETAVDITAVEFKAVTNDFFEAEGKHYLTIWFCAKHLAGEAVVSAAYEMSELGWFGWDELPKRSVPPSSASSMVRALTILCLRYPPSTFSRSNLFTRRTRHREEGRGLRRGAAGSLR